MSKHPLINKSEKPGALDTLIPLHIDRMAFGGSGVGRYGSLVIFVPGSAPDEDLMVEIESRKKNFAIGKIREIVKPSPYRRSPPCLVADRCGGCNWQHIEDSEQLRQKSQIVESTLKKFLSDLALPPVKAHPSPKSFRYRNRIQPKYQNGRMGFFAKNSSEIIDTVDCLIAEEKISSSWGSAKTWAFEQTKKITQNRKIKDPILKFEIRLTPENGIEFTEIQERSKSSIPFSQVNRFQNQNLIESVLAMCKKLKGGQILDLYAGGGNFSIPLANSHPDNKILAIELNSTLVNFGKLQASQLGLKNLDFISSDVDEFLKNSKLDGTHLVILDPPRTGSSEFAMKTLVSQGVKNIIYISCHPVTLARDLKWLNDWNLQLRRKSIKVQELEVFEMFPQTDHVETIVSLEIDY